MAAETTLVPHNLPTVGYETFLNLDVDEQALREDEEALTALENEAHEQKVLLSSDAMRYFVASVSSRTERHSLLKEVLTKAHISFPSEEGWVVLNLSRMEVLLQEVLGTLRAVTEEKKDLEHSHEFIPMHASSLAEAIVSKNITAAYALMSNRPMIALADAASDVDALYRSRKGEEVIVSDMLKAYTRELSTDTLQELAIALTSALDGTYQTEEEAVKMAILKAVQVLK